jgi:hypothetical protein
LDVDLAKGEVKDMAWCYLCLIWSIIGL